MTQEEKTNIVAAMLQSGKVDIGQFVVENNGTMNYNASANNIEAKGLLSKQNLKEVIRDTQKYFWGQASYAVMFCVMRDYFQYAGSMSQFERDVENNIYDFERSYLCPAGTLKMAFKNNDYFSLPIDRWKENGAKERTLTLANKVKESLENLS